VPTRGLAHLVFWLFAVLAAASQVAILRAMVAGRAPAASRRPMARWAEVAWVLIPAVVLVAVLVATWQAIGRQPVPMTGPLTLG
jgi:hypothetical protein